MHCHFDEVDDEPSEIVISNSSEISLNGWILLGFSEDTAMAYWRKDERFIHWTRITSDSDSELPEIHSEQEDGECWQDGQLNKADTDKAHTKEQGSDDSKVDGE